MFNPWLAFSLNAFQIGVEAQSVIALRMLRFASGNARSETEATRMVTEKIAAAAEAQAVAAMATISAHRATRRRQQSAQGLQKARSSQQTPADCKPVDTVAEHRFVNLVLAERSEYRGISPPFAMRRERSQPASPSWCASRKRPQSVLIKAFAIWMRWAHGHSSKGASMPLRHQLPTGTQKGDRCP